MFVCLCVCRCSSALKYLTTTALWTTRRSWCIPYGKFPAAQKSGTPIYFRLLHVNWCFSAFVIASNAVTVCLCCCLFYLFDAILFFSSWVSLYFSDILFTRISCLCWNTYIKSQLACTDYEGAVTLYDTATGQVVTVRFCCCCFLLLLLLLCLLFVVNVWLPLFPVSMLCFSFSLFHLFVHFISFHFCFLCRLLRSMRSEFGVLILREPNPHVWSLAPMIQEVSASVAVFVIVVLFVFI